MEDSSVAVNSRCQQLLTYRVVDIYIYTYNLVLCGGMRYERES